MCSEEILAAIDVWTGSDANKMTSGPGEKLNNERSREGKEETEEWRISVLFPMLHSS